MFRSDTFFDLTTFEYANVFDGIEQVWEVLSHLEAYLMTHTSPENCIRGTVHPDASLMGQHILIEEEAIIEPGACIQGPCIIGRGCLVRHGAYVRAVTLAGARSIIGHATETKNAILFPESAAAHFAYVGDSILGNRVNLGAGTKLANWRLGGGAIAIKIDGQLHTTGRDKLGAIIGDDCHVGCNSVCNPGTLLGPGCLVHPITSVRGYYPACSVLKPSSM